MQQKVPFNSLLNSNFYFIAFINKYHLFPCIPRSMETILAECYFHLRDPVRETRGVESEADSFESHALTATIFQ